MIRTGYPSDGSVLDQDNFVMESFSILEQEYISFQLDIQEDNKKSGTSHEEIKNRFSDGRRK